MVKYLKFNDVLNIINQEIICIEQDPKTILFTLKKKKEIRDLVIYSYGRDLVNLYNIKKYLLNHV